LDFSIEHPIAQKRSYSCGTTLTRQADSGISHFIAIFLLSSDENHSYCPGNCLQHPVGYV
jgi:hypothetical protein